MIISTRVAVLAGLCAAALTVPASASHRWNVYHWAGDGSNLTLKMNKAITSQWETSVHNAIVDWDLSTELTLIEQNAPAGTSRKRCNPIAGQILICNDSYGRRGWLGVATIWLSNGHITQGTTKLNDSYHNSSPYNQPEWRALVACQEPGHNFGLAHQDENFSNANLGTCMDYTNSPLGPPPNITPNAHDYQELSAIYNHDDGYTSATSSTNFGIRQVGKAAPESSSDAGAGDTMAEWGRAIHQDGKGRPDVFVRQLPDGRKMITHVFWALEAKGTEAQ